MEQTIEIRALLPSGHFVRLDENRKDRSDAKMDEKEKKQVPLRLTASLWKELVIWAEEDFRSLNGQIEFLLHEAVTKRRKPENEKM